MGYSDMLHIFQAHTKNVRVIERAWRHVNRSVNLALRKDDHASAKMHTKLLCLIFTSWVEANFSKIIHTPYGFSQDEIDQIKNEWNTNGLGFAWKKALDLGLRHASHNASKSNYIPNVKRMVTSHINRYVIEPSIIRNKIAHGQWEIALNKNGDAHNEEVTTKLSDLNVVTLSRWFVAHRVLANILELLIESPQRAFHKYFWDEITRLDKHIKDTEKWTIDEKINKLKKKKYNNRGNTNGT